MRITLSDLSAVCAGAMAFCLVGCSTAAHLKTDDTGRTPASVSSSSSVQVYSTNNIGKTYTTLGVVVSSADSGDDSSGAVDKLREEAARLGANAIVNLRLEINYGYWDSAVRASGVAVRY